MTQSEFCTIASRKLGFTVTKGNIRGALEAFDKTPSDIFVMPVATGTGPMAIAIGKLTLRIEELESQVENIKERLHDAGA